MKRWLARACFSILALFQFPVERCYDMSFLENAETDLEVVGKKLVGEEDKERANDWYFTSVKIKMVCVWEGTSKTRKKKEQY